MRWRAILAVGLLLNAAAQPSRQVFAVVSIPGVEAYEQAIAGIRERLPDIEVWDARDDSGARERLSRTPPAVAIVLGSGSGPVLERLSSSRVALLRSLVLASDLEETGGRVPQAVSALTVDLPPHLLMAEIARLFPGRTRIGVLRGPAHGAGYVKALEAAARRSGLTLQVQECAHARDVVDAFLQLRGRADLVWCPPDPQLYTSATLKPLLVASLTNRLPIIGFSEQFVQAGALFGGSADFREAGRQTAALALQLSRSEPVPQRQEARKFRFAYNQRVARLIGVRAADPEQPGEGVTVYR